MSRDRIEASREPQALREAQVKSRRLSGRWTIYRMAAYKLYGRGRYLHQEPQSDGRSSEGSRPSERTRHAA